ncbi:MAG: DUF3883 domain-containing protein [Phycisphaeraceae bacterium]|nr:DUF3883 domain-containing protein [Phycisphaeraceae bacterium]
MAERKKTARSTPLIEIEAVIVAYAMSRLDQTFLDTFGFTSWKQAFARVGEELRVTPASIKNLRDEFDPLHGHRKGWHMRPLRPNRQRVLGEFAEVSDAALTEIVRRIRERDGNIRSEIAAPLANVTKRVENVAERLLTGRLAEEFFMRHSAEICGIAPTSLVDSRSLAQGFDFAVRKLDSTAIEVKGLKSSRGEILFTDLEWRQAATRRADYWLVVVGRLDTRPKAQLFKDPHRSLEARSDIRTSTTVSWKATVAVV